MMKRIALLIGLITLTVGLCHGAAGRGQMRDAAEIPLTLAAGGEPQAVIVIAPQRPRMVTLAALELRHYVEKMSGARLPIVTDATGVDGVKIYLGNSPGVERLGVSSDGLHYGAFRVASGVDWIVVIGTDIDYVPPAVASLSRADIPRANAAWDAMTEGLTVGWGNPFRSEFRKYWNPNSFAKTFEDYYGEDAIDWWRGNLRLRRIPVRGGDVWAPRRHEFRH